MPFSKHLIDPAHIEAMRAAFRNVCDALMLKCDVGDPMTEVIVAKIVALAENIEVGSVIIRSALGNCRYGCRTATRTRQRSAGSRGHDLLVCGETSESHTIYSSIAGLLS
jgi:hypothetical protein